MTVPFWKKSEDPWDIEPGRQISPTEEPEEDREGLLDTVKAWGEKLKTSLRKEEEPEGTPERCPWCGKDMEKGYVTGGRDPVRWSRKKPGLLRGCDSAAVRVDDEGNFFTYKTAWYCRDCGKLVLALAPPETLNSPENQDQQEYERELRSYAEWAKRE